MLTSARRPKFRSAASSAVLAASLLLGACSKNNVATSSTSTPPTVTTAITDPAGYVATICASGAKWQRALQQRVSEFTTAQTGVTDLNVARQNLVDYLNGLAADTDTFVTAVETAGAPPVKNGDS